MSVVSVVNRYYRRYSLAAILSNRQCLILFIIYIYLYVFAFLLGATSAMRNSLLLLLCQFDILSNYSILTGQLGSIMLVNVFIFFPLTIFCDNQVSQVSEMLSLNAVLTMLGYRLKLSFDVTLRQY